MKGKDNLPVDSLEKALIAAKREETGGFEGDCNNCKITATVRRNVVVLKRKRVRLIGLGTGTCLLKSAEAQHPPEIAAIVERTTGRRRLV